MREILRQVVASKAKIVTYDEHAAELHMRSAQTRAESNGKNAQGKQKKYMQRHANYCAKQSSMYNSLTRQHDFRSVCFRIGFEVDLLVATVRDADQRSELSPGFTVAKGKARLLQSQECTGWCSPPPPPPAHLLRYLPGSCRG